MKIFEYFAVPLSTTLPVPLFMIIVKLVPESNDVSDGQIVKEIIAEAEISWAEKIEKVTISRKV